jgi:hypothetical protein
MRHPKDDPERTGEVIGRAIEQAKRWLTDGAHTAVTQSEYSARATDEDLRLRRLALRQVDPAAAAEVDELEELAVMLSRRTPYDLATCRVLVTRMHERRLPRSLFDYGIGWGGG